MIDRLHNSWRLFLTTLNVLSHDKELLIFPLFSGLAAIVIMATFVAGVWASGLLESLVAAAENNSVGAVHVVPSLLTALAFYFSTYFVMNYFNAALVGAAFIRLRGGDPTVSDGFAAANRCLNPLIGYSFIAATVGMFLNALQNSARQNFVGRLAVGLAGMAWTLVTYLVVPVLVLERLRPIAAIQRSTALLKHTWGEQIIANFGLGLVSFFFSLLGFAISALGLWAWSQLGAPPAIAAVAVGVALVYWVLLGILMSALRGIYNAALYGHASGQEIRGLPAELVSGAFSTR